MCVWWHNPGKETHAKRWQTKANGPNGRQGKIAANKHLVLAYRVPIGVLYCLSYWIPTFPSAFKDLTDMNCPHDWLIHIRQVFEVSGFRLRFGVDIVIQPLITNSTVKDQPCKWLLIWSGLDHCKHGPCTMKSQRGLTEQISTMAGDLAVSHGRPTHS